MFLLVSPAASLSLPVFVRIHAGVRRQHMSDRVKPVLSSLFFPTLAYSDVAVRFCHRQTSVGFYSLLVYIFRYKAAGCIGSR